MENSSVLKVSIKSFSEKSKKICYIGVRWTYEKLECSNNKNIIFKHGKLVRKESGCLKTNRRQRYKDKI